MIKLYHPGIFQGSLNKKNYFEGWYLKHVSENLGHAFSLIPGIALNSKEPHSFVQYINGITAETHYFQFPLAAFKWDKEKFAIEIDGNHFSQDGLDVHLEDGSFSVLGSATYTDSIPYPSTMFSPGIMGWYSFVPFMECKHGVISLNHKIRGDFNINGSPIRLDNGNGYIEKDWGSSFPEAWIWLQCNNFSIPQTCLMFSVAKIPWLGKFFMGFISFLYYRGELILFSTYNKSRLLKAQRADNLLIVSMQNKDYSLEITATAQGGGILKAPQAGLMERHIKESIDAEVTILLKDKQGRPIFSDSGKRAGLEVMEGIFKYL